MRDTLWCLIDTETTGLRAPIYVVEIAAQKMLGWEPIGKPFQRMINHGMDIPPEAARVHGYTREILERDGDMPTAVYHDFAKYVDGVPLAAYNLGYDWDEVLLPEWKRLGLSTAGKRGLCILELAKRLLDPVPAGNCKLQTLRQYYHLPLRGAHTALGDVETVLDLLQRVLRPLCESRALVLYKDLETFCNKEWFPARIPFGKFKGRLFRDALNDSELYGWLQWLTHSNNDRTRSMGEWYLSQLGQPELVRSEAIFAADETSLVLYDDANKERLRFLVEQARNRLADLEAEFTALCQATNLTQSLLFKHLRQEYQERDMLRLRLELRRKYLETLLNEGEEEAAQVEAQRVEAEEKLEQEYENTAQSAEGRQPLSDEQAAELKQLWRRLVKLFHPDRLMSDPERQAVYERLTAEINRARDDGNIALLREIAEDTQGFILRRGWGQLHSLEVEDLTELKKLYDGLQAQILNLLTMLDEFRSSPAFELHVILRTDPTQIDAIVTEYRATLKQEISDLSRELGQVEFNLMELEKVKS